LQLIQKQKTQIVHDESFMSLSYTLKKLKRAPSVMFKPEHIKSNPKSTKEGDLGIIKIKPQDINKLKPTLKDAKIQTKTADLELMARRAEAHI
jgi:hypothetical protein